MTLIPSLLVKNMMLESMENWSRAPVNPIPATITRAFAAFLFTLLACAPSYGQQDTPELDQAYLRQSVESTAAIVDRRYFDADVAAQAASFLREELAEGRYSGAETLEDLARMLTRDLFAVTKDKHLAVAVVENRSLDPASTNSDKDREARARRTNFGVQRVEVLAGNVGYLNLTSFYRLEEAQDAISAAMRVLRSVDALILDLRENSGGSPETVALVASYLFDASGLPLFEILPRAGTGGREYTTLEPGIPERNGTRPVYVLTAQLTFSAGEGLAFLLQERHRAIVVGEQTAGAANPGRPYPVNASLSVTVPNGQVRTAATGRNWEGDGVVPDVTVPASDALRTAHVRALRALIEHVENGPWQDTLSRELKTLELSNGP